METYLKRMVYFNPHFPTQESVAILQCGYQESGSGHISTQRIVEDYVLHCITGGKGTYTVNGKKYHLKKGDCFLLLPGVPLLYQADIKPPGFITGLVSKSSPPCPFSPYAALKKTLL